MPSVRLSMKEQERYLAIAQNMFRKEPKGQIVLSEMVGQLDFWNEDKDSGFIKTWDQERKTYGERFYCHGSAFSTRCAVKDIVRFDVWENVDTHSRKAVNVETHRPAFTEVSKGETGTLVRLFPGSGKGLIRGPSGQTFRCSEDDFDETVLAGDRVQFDSIKDNFTDEFRAVKIRSAKIEAYPRWSQKEWDQWRSQWTTKEWDQWRSQWTTKDWKASGDKSSTKDCKAPSDALPACDASTAASEGCTVESLVDDLASIVAEDEWQPVVHKQNSKAPQAPKMEQLKTQQPQPRSSIFRPICRCCLLPGTHFADKCVVIQRRISSEQKLQKREELENDKLDRLAALRRRRAHEAEEREHAAWEQRMMRKEQQQAQELVRLACS